MMRRRSWIVGLFLALWLAGMIPALGYAADADRQAFTDLLNDLDQKIKDADSRMIAHPKFLDELRALVKQYRSKLRVVFLSDDFSDGDYGSNPLWTVDSGTFQVTNGRRLMSEVAAERPSATRPAQEKMSPLTGVLRDILKAPAEEEQTETATTPREARIHTMATIGPGFEVDLGLVSRSTGGRMEIVLLGGDQTTPYYRMIYRASPSAERPIEVVRERDGKSYTVDIANQYPVLDDGAPHRIQWIRDSQGRMRIVVDGKEVLSTYEFFYRGNFTGLALVNRGGTYEWGPVMVYQAQETKVQ
jgi:hypothetical protein